MMLLQYTYSNVTLGTSPEVSGIYIIQMVTLSTSLGVSGI